MKLRRKVKLRLHPSRDLTKPTREQAVAAVRTLIAYIGEDPDRQGVLLTPERVVQAWEQDWGLGYNEEWIKKQSASIFKGKFNDGAQVHSQLIVVKDISFHSFCEHHIAEFSGKADIGYIPAEGGPILGLSKLARVVDLFSRKLQVQERLTDNVADFINKYCSPIGVGVVIHAKHSCMRSRGVRQPESVAVTSALRGEMLTHPEVRDEFYRMVGR